jgi:hypothetical protein
MPPRVGECLPEAGQRRECAGQEDSSSTTKPVVEWDSEPAANNGTAEVGSRVDKSQEPCGPGIFTTDSKMLAVKELRPVDDRLVYMNFISCDLSL